MRFDVDGTYCENERLLSVRFVTIITWRITTPLYVDGGCSLTPNNSIMKGLNAAKENRNISIPSSLASVDQEIYIQH